MTENTPAIKNNMPLMPSNEEFQMLQIIAKNAQDSGMYKGVGQTASIFMVLLAARELGVSPMLALNGGIWNIQGKVEISSRLMNGLIRRAGHSIHIVKSDDEVCTLKGTRSDGDSFEVTFSKDDAIKAGLWGSNTWKKYPSDMLYNRCMSRLARRLFSDVIGTAYIEGEIKEAKEIEKKEKELAQAEYEEIRHNPETLKTITMDAPQNTTEHIVDANKLVDDVLRINQEELETFIKFYAQTNDVFKENFEKHMQTKWNIKDFQGIASKDFHACMTAITRNIEMQSMPKGN
jgi:hypothetical protein